MAYCPICDQKMPLNCDCSPAVKHLHEESEEKDARIAALEARLRACEAELKDYKDAAEVEASLGDEARAELAARDTHSCHADCPRTACVLRRELDEAVGFVRSFVAEWDSTWTDPDDISHEWADLYQEAKDLLARHPEPRGETPTALLGKEQH